MVNTLISTDELKAAVSEMLEAKAALAAARQLDSDAEARHSEAVGRMNEVYREKREYIRLIANDDRLDADSEENLSFLASYVDWLAEEHERLNEGEYYPTLFRAWHAGEDLDSARARARQAERLAWGLHQNWRHAE